MPSRAKKTTGKAPSIAKPATRSAKKRPTPRAKAPRVTPPPANFTFDPTATFESARVAYAKYVAERQWDQFHTPRNLVLTLVGEVGEVAEVFRFATDEECSDGLARWSAEKREALGDELADVLWGLVRLADVCRVDLPAASARKLVKSAAKYPADKVRGSCKKYTEYSE